MKQKEISPFDAFSEEECKVFSQISVGRKYVLLCILPEKGPRAAKISWRAACGPRVALWPCLLYDIETTEDNLLYRLFVVATIFLSANSLIHIDKIGQK